MLSGNNIRQQYLEFFKKKGHSFVKSAPVIPFDDPTLLFTNAGMNQFKDIFIGTKETSLKRVVDSQKCIRAGGKHNDLEEVGRDGYHHTFFEMLGNWSFGDYYKKEAIQWAWELLTEIWELPKEKLYATVHDSDNEAYEIWNSETDIKSEHIEYHGDKDNFWEMGDTGPCGPCSEIHIDRGENFCNLKEVEGHVCKVNGDCHRYIELWNLVFIQYFRNKNRELQPLAQKYVDTGAGFERLVQVLQNKNSNYETDLFIPILHEIEEMSGAKYFADDRGISHRVIADHIRALTFSLADGGMPSNEGRGYVLRRILRRAARHGRLLGFTKPFLHRLVDVVDELMRKHYPEVNERKSHIKMIIKAEEERFNLTLDKGISKFNEITESIADIIPGRDAFMLYDTFGFPLDLTMIMAEEKGLIVAEDDFHKEMQKQKERARKAAKFSMNLENIEWIKFLEDSVTEFVGYYQSSVTSKIVKYSVDDNNNVKIVLDKTPFYAESGGQVADIGKIFNDYCEIQITDVQKQNDMFIHIGFIKKGTINSNNFTAIIESEMRKNIARNHTVTHLLHKALKEVLGDHVHQKGSLVNADHLRFDFTHFQQVSTRELRIVEHIVNRKIRECLPVSTKVMSIDDAKEEGATALFGEKYGENVRVVTIGDFSKELCGGTHLSYTGEIGLFKITSESSIAAGIRRIEAITGERVEKYIHILEDEMDEIARNLASPRTALQNRIEKLLQEHKEFQITIKKMNLKNTGNLMDDLIARAKIINGIKVVAAKIDVKDVNSLRQIGDQMKGKVKSGIGVLIANISGKVSILAMVSKDLVSQYPAGKIVSEIAKVVGGKGGGRPDMAMAGGKETEKIEVAVKQVFEVIKDMSS